MTTALPIDRVSYLITSLFKPVGLTKSVKLAHQILKTIEAEKGDWKEVFHSVKILKAGLGLTEVASFYEEAKEFISEGKREKHPCLFVLFVSGFDCAINVVSSLCEFGITAAGRWPTNLARKVPFLGGRLVAIVTNEKFGLALDLIGASSKIFANYKKIGSITEFKLNQANWFKVTLLSTTVKAGLKLAELVGYRAGRAGNWIKVACLCVDVADVLYNENSNYAPS